MLKYAFLMIFAACFFICRPVTAQVDNELSVQVEEQLEATAGNGEDAIDLSELMDNKDDARFRPVNINKASFAELYDCNLFTEHQITSIVSHRNNFGPFITIEELQVAGFEASLIRSLKPFITFNKSVDAPNAGLKRMLKEGRHTVITRMQWINERKRGFKQVNGTVKYLGDPRSYYLRYRFNFMKKISVAFVCENDAGEPFFNKYQRSGFDFYAGHIAIRDLSLFKIITVGDYQLQYGQGLSLWSGLSGGRSADPVFVVKQAVGIKPYQSSNEAFFNRGVAASMHIHDFNLDLFYSYRKPDANLYYESNDLVSEGQISSIQQSGYHRTLNEINAKNSISEQLYGFNLSYHLNNLHIGTTTYQTLLSKGLLVNNKPYNTFRFSGEQNIISGFDYKWFYRNFNFFGELSYSKFKHYAYLTGVIISADPRLILSILIRNYRKEFQNSYAGAFSEGSSGSGEKGIYGSISYQLSRQFSFTCSYDYYYFPWLKYRTDAPSNGNEFQCRFTYKPSRSTELYFRLRQEVNMLNSNAVPVKSKYAEPVQRKGLRINATVKISKSFTLKSRVEFARYNHSSDNESGIVVMQDIKYHPMGFPVSWNMRYALFDSESYDSRIYAYENDVLYGYSIPAYYYKGSRFYLNTRIKLRKGLDFWFKYALTVYVNQEEIGSGWEQIEGNRKSEFKVQLVYSSR